MNINYQFMNKIILTLAAIITMSFAACAQNNKGEKNMQTENKPLVVYFSATGTTAKAARMISDVTGGALYEIVPQQAYTSEDLDWNNRQSRSSVEMNNPQARPTLKDTKVDVAAYDVIFIGYPIWWDLAPRIINTFIERLQKNITILLAQKHFIRPCKDYITLLCSTKG